MAIKLMIPDEIEQALRIPKREQVVELDKELALSLYLREALSFGKARQLAGLSKWEFQKELKKRKIMRHYSEKELVEDVAYAREHRRGK